jgi:hypothetical protein
MEEAALMPALSTSTYGKGSTVTTSTDFADRITAIAETALTALEALDRNAATGGVADQGAVNTLRKVATDLGALANDTRQAAHDEQQKLAEDKTAAAKAPVTGTSTPAGSGTTKS